MALPIDEQVTFIYLVGGKNTNLKAELVLPLPSCCDSVAKKLVGASAWSHCTLMRESNHAPDGARCVMTPEARYCFVELRCRYLSHTMFVISMLSHIFADCSLCAS